MSINIQWIGDKTCFEFDEAAARSAMLDCGFDEGAFSESCGVEILASYDNPGSVIEVVIRAAGGWYAGNNSDGWNKTNSLQEVLGTTAAEIDEQFGECASETSLWQAFLDRQ